MYLLYDVCGADNFTVRTIRPVRPGPSGSVRVRTFRPGPYIPSGSVRVRPGPSGSVRGLTTFKHVLRDSPPWKVSIYFQGQTPIPPTAQTVRVDLEFSHFD